MGHALSHRRGNARRPPICKEPPPPPPRRPIGYVRLAWNHIPDDIHTTFDATLDLFPAPSTGVFNASANDDQGRAFTFTVDFAADPTQSILDLDIPSGHPDWSHWHGNGQADPGVRPWTSTEDHFVSNDTLGDAMAQVTLA